MFTRLGCSGRPPHFRVEFYPYSTLALTIRRRDDTMLVRLSDLLRRAPWPVLEGAAVLLLSKIYRRKAPLTLTTPYVRYARSHRTRSRIHRMRRRRMASLGVVPGGRRFDLLQLFEQLNDRYFDGRLRRPQIGWSNRSWRRQFGCYDPGPNHILLNRRMDGPDIPQFVVEYVLFHEMLHLKHPARRSGCTLVSLPANFARKRSAFRTLPARAAFSTDWHVKVWFAMQIATHAGCCHA
jgi:hypothetical protein